MNDYQLATRTASTEPVDSTRLDRRKAMKAALGGAAAGATFVAPKVAGFSVAPDYAAAASCTGGNSTLTHNSEKPDYCAVYCWGGKNGNTFIDCGGLCANGCCKDESQSLTLSGTNFKLTFDVGGSLCCYFCGTNGGYRYEIEGIDPPFQKCNLSYNISNQCTGPANLPITHHNNVPMNNWVGGMNCNDCNNNKFLTITFACECNNTANA